MMKMDRSAIITRSSLSQETSGKLRASKKPRKGNGTWNTLLWCLFFYIMPPTDGLKIIQASQVQSMEVTSIYVSGPFPFSLFPSLDEKGFHCPTPDL